MVIQTFVQGVFVAKTLLKGLSELPRIFTRSNMGMFSKRNGFLLFCNPTTGNVL